MDLCYNKVDDKKGIPIRKEQKMKSFFAGTLFTIGLVLAMNEGLWIYNLAGIIVSGIAVWLINR